MKVLHIINNLLAGGAEKLIVDTLPIYNEKGITADLLVQEKRRSITAKTTSLTILQDIFY